MTEIDTVKQTKEAPIVTKSSRSASTIILACSLAVVLFYFGINEVLSPQDWIVFVPTFFGIGNFVITLVIAHGILLVTLGVALVFNFHRKIAAAVVALFLLEIAVSLIFQAGFSDVAIRDIGLFGAAVALCVMP